jgi:SAM-dependent methyltransferase
MSFNPLAALIVSQTVPYLRTAPTVVELGNQTFRAHDEILDKIIPEVKSRRTNAIADIQELMRIRQLTPENRLALTERYYRALGFSQYVSIDLTDDYGARVMDLNVILQDHYDFRDQFDLVTNNGTGEHIFSQLAVFSNVHNLARSGGIMLHILPFIGWVNHGFYCFNPTIFGDVARENNYEVLRIAVGDRWGNVYELPVPSCFGILGKSGRDFVDVISRARKESGEQLLIVAALRKTEAKEFSVPTQGLYNDVIAKDRRAI